MFKNIISKAFIVVLLVLTFFGIFSSYGKTVMEDKPLPSFNVLTDYISSNRHTMTDDLTPVLSPNQINPEDTIIQTDLGDVYLDEESLSFMVLNDRGYLWSSTIDYEESGLSENWKRRVRSAVHIFAYNTKTTNHAKTEEFVLSKNSTSATTIIENGFESTITFGVSRISILLRVTFTSDGIKVEIPNDRIEEETQYKIGSIYVYPYFGAAKEDTIPGYMFVPDGVGALVRYPKTSTLRQYSKEFFGNHLAYNTEADLNKLPTEGASLYAPVFGFVHGINQNAIFARIDEGAEYGILTMNFAGSLTNYNTIFSEFVYRRIYNQPIDKAGNVITLMQEKREKFNVKIHYELLTDEEANYVGMAKAYRSHLEDKEAFIKQIDSYKDTLLKLESIGLEKSVGILFSNKTVMTSFNNLSEMVLKLNPKITEILVAFRGFSKDGTSWEAPGYKGISNRVGNKKDLENLKSKVNELYFIMEFMKASNRSGDYQAYKDLAKKINEQTYRFKEFNDIKYLLKHQTVLKNFEKAEKSYKTYAVDGFALSSVGEYLYNDYAGGINILEQIPMYQEMLSSKEFKNALYNAYSYLWAELDHYFDTPMYTSQYISFTDTVPFIPIVLKGYKEMFSANANFYDYARDQLLRNIDYGINLSFVVTKESSKLLQDTPLNYIYTSKFNDLKPAILTYYDFQNKALSYVNGSAINSRRVIENGLVKVVYENNHTIYINYLNEEKLVDGFNLLPKNYIVVYNNEIISGNYKVEVLS